MKGNVAVDLFCGGGCLSIGTEEAGFDVKLAVDGWSMAVENYNHYRGREIARVKDVKEINGEYIVERCGTNIALIEGGPPCPGFSMAGKQDVMDPRNLMIDEFYRIIDEVRPRYFLMENVVGMKTMKRPDGKTLVVDWILDRVKNMGYGCKWKKMVASSYGVPQHRSRIIFVGWKHGVPVPKFPPRPTHLKYSHVDFMSNPPKRIPSWITVRKAFSSIPPDALNQDLVYKFKKESYIERVKLLKPGESVYHYSESHKKLKWDEPAFTIKENHGSIAIHPEEIRMINLREMATLQDFPMNYEFVGNNRDIAKMIGNAMPRGMARAICEEIMKANEHANIN